VAVEGHEIVQAVGSSMLQALEGIGLDEERLAELINAELGATLEQAYYDPKGKKGQKWQYSKAQAVWGIRQKARQDINRLKGHFAIEEAGTVRPVSVNINLGSEGENTLDGGEAEVVPAGEIEEGEEG